MTISSFQQWYASATPSERVEIKEACSKMDSLNFTPPGGMFLVIAGDTTQRVSPADTSEWMGCFPTKEAAQAIQEAIKSTWYGEVSVVDLQRWIDGSAPLRSANKDKLRDAILKLNS